jgi:hypothetical protein
MEDEKFIINEIVKLNRQMIIGVQESFDKIDFQYGRRIGLIEIHTDRIMKILEILRNELREQYHSLARRIDLLEFQTIKLQNEVNIKDKQITAKEILSEIENMRDKERSDLLNKLFNKYYEKV